MNLKAAVLERKAAQDVLISVAAVLAVSCSAYFFDLNRALAVWTGLDILSEVNPSIWVITYTVWILSIFVLRRMEDIYALMRHRNAFEQQSFDQRRSDYLAQMAGGVIHDINNVMTAIRGFGEVAQLQIDANSPASESIHGILTATERAANLVRYLTDFSNGREVPEELLQVSGIVRGMEPIIRYLCKSGNIRLQTRMEEDAGWTRISRTRIEEVLLNLVMNAVQAMDGKSGQLTIVVDRMTLVEDMEYRQRNVKAGDYIRLSVTDTGSGMEERLVDRIFDPYFTTKSKGCGLGLAVVRQVVLAAGGFVRVKSKPGDGSTFTAYLPCADRSTIDAHDLVIS